MDQVPGCAGAGACRNETFERVGSRVHYIPLNVADRGYDVNACHTAQQSWYQEEIDVAFQLDGNYAQQPYSEWPDEVNLLTN